LARFKIWIEFRRWSTTLAGPKPSAFCKI